MTHDRNRIRNLPPVRVAGFFINDARSYFSASEKLNELDGHFSPKYFLLSHALELALKAYILTTNGTESDIYARNHNLQKATTSPLQTGASPVTRGQVKRLPSLRRHTLII
jgi:hypothetical protein